MEKENNLEQIIGQLTAKEGLERSPERYIDGVILAIAGQPEQSFSSSEGRPFENLLQEMFPDEDGFQRGRRLNVIEAIKIAEELELIEANFRGQLKVYKDLTGLELTKLGKQYAKARNGKSA